MQAESRSVKNGGGGIHWGK